MHTNMSDTSNRNAKPPFRGFTDIFRRVNEQKEDPAQALPSRNVHSLEYEPRRPSSLKLEIFDNNKPAIAEQVAQPERAPPILVPPLVTYEEWFAERISHAVARCRELYGPINEFEQAVDGDVRRLVSRMKRCSAADAAGGGHDQSCHCADCRASTNDHRKEIYERCNVNAYPQKYEFDLLNKRLRKIITNKCDPRWLRDFVHRSILKDSVLKDRYQGGKYDRYGAERHELTRLVNERLQCPPSTEVRFQPESLSEWRAKNAFKIDRKYLYIPKVATLVGEDFEEWLERARNALDRKRNKDCIKRAPNRVGAGGEVGSAEGPDAEAPLEARQYNHEAREPSLSHCRSEFFYNGIR